MVGVLRCQAPAVHRHGGQPRQEAGAGQPVVSHRPAGAAAAEAGGVAAGGARHSAVADAGRAALAEAEQLPAMGVGGRRVAAAAGRAARVFVAVWPVREGGGAPVGIHGVQRCASCLGLRQHIRVPQEPGRHILGAAGAALGRQVGGAQEERQPARQRALHPHPQPAVSRVAPPQRCRHLPAVRQQDSYAAVPIWPGCYKHPAVSWQPRQRLARLQVDLC